MSLKGITVNTAPAEAAHIYAEDDAAIYQSIFGADGVFSVGDKLKATVISNNIVRVGNGVLCVGGHIGRTIYGDYTDMTIENGISGNNRNDIIVARFSTTGPEGIDTIELAVKKGTAGATATDPALTQGDLYTGSKLREIPLWRVKLEGISIVKVEQMFKVIPTIPQLESDIGKLTSNIEIADKKFGTVSEFHIGQREIKATGNENEKVTLTFADRGTVPKVFLQVVSAVPDKIVNCTPSNITRTNFTINLRRETTADTTVQYLIVW